VSTLVRRERLVAEARGEGRGALVRAWHKLEAVLRPVKLLGGLVLLAVSLVVFASMLITGIDKAKNSACGARCGYVLGATRLFQPLNALLVLSARAFPLDYVLLLLLVAHLFAASVAGLSVVGIRALWVTVFRVRRGRTSPQALLLATVLLALVGLAIDYAVVTMVAPRYAIFGPQTYCDAEPRHPGEQPDCGANRSAIRPCSERATNKVAQHVCTPSVASTFINRMTVNFPFFGVVDFWAQFAFLGPSPPISSHRLTPTRRVSPGLRRDPLPRAAAGRGRARRGRRGRRGGGAAGEHGEAVRGHVAGHHGEVEEARRALRGHGWAGRGGAEWRRHCGGVGWHAVRTRLGFDLILDVPNWLDGRGYDIPTLLKLSPCITTIGF